MERTCTAPAGKQLFFPVVNYVFFITEPGETEEIARQAVNDYIDGLVADPRFKMRVTVDGRKVKSSQIIRADSPLFTATVPEGGLLPAGSYDGVTDGLWVTLPSLPEGEHTIRFTMSAPNAGFCRTTHTTSPWSRERGAGNREPGPEQDPALRRTYPRATARFDSERQVQVNERPNATATGTMATKRLRASEGTGESREDGTRQGLNPRCQGTLLALIAFGALALGLLVLVGSKPAWAAVPDLCTGSG